MLSTKTRCFALCILVLVMVSGASAASTSLATSDLTAFRQTGVDVPIPSGQTYVLYPSHDSFTNDKAKNDNRGDEEKLIVSRDQSSFTFNGSTVTVKKARTYIRFDMSTVCSGPVTSALLTLTGPATNNVGGNHFHYHPIEETWDESTITKNNRPDTGEHIDAPWSTISSGGNMVATIAVKSTLDDVDGDITVESGLIDSLGNFDPNSDPALYGWELKDWQRSQWYSSEQSNPALRPTLTIEVSSCP